VSERVVDVGEPGGDELRIGVGGLLPAVPGHEGVEFLEAERRELRDQAFAVAEVVSGGGVGDSGTAGALPQGETLDSLFLYQFLSHLQQGVPEGSVMVGPLRGSLRALWFHRESPEPNAAIPAGLAVLLDGRQVNDVSIWLKPVKFLTSLAIYFGTLAWLHGYLPDEGRDTKIGRTLVDAPIAIGLLEMTWLVATAVLGVPSHFNRSAPVYELSYALAGLGATLLMVVVLTMGIRIGRARTSVLPSGFRLSIVLGCVVAFVGTMVTAGFLASGNGHWVGGSHSDAGGLALVGWSRTGGDLRGAHFFGLHALQVIPLFGSLVTRAGIGKPRAAVLIAAGLYAGFIGFTFLQALSGRPFL
jgi:hypothetical protein